MNQPRKDPFHLYFVSSHSPQFQQPAGAARLRSLWSQNGFWAVRAWQKTLNSYIAFYFYYKKAGKQDYYMTHVFSVSN
jgi:hypothetical protein